MVKRTSFERAVLSFVFGATVFATSLAFWLLLAAVFPKPAAAAKVVETWPYPQTATVYGSEPLLCPAGYRPHYRGAKVGLMSWNFLPPATKPQIHRAPNHVCLSADGDGHPFFGFAYVVDIVEQSPCVLCVLGDFPTD